MMNESVYYYYISYIFLFCLSKCKIHVVAKFIVF